MKPQHLIAKPSSSSFPSASLPWISPLQYLKQPPPKPSPPLPLPSPPSGPPRFLSHADTVRLINRQSDPRRALDIFNSAAAQPGFSHNHATYSAVVLRLARARKFLAVDDLLRRMALEPCRFDEALFLLLMLLFARVSLLEKTLDLFHSIAPIVRQKPSPKAVATCLDLLVVSGRFDLAQKLLSHAKIKFDIEPNTSFITFWRRNIVKLAILIRRSKFSRR